MASIVVAAVAEPVDTTADTTKLPTQDAQLASDQIVQLHRELSDAAVAESAHAARIVWAQVKGFPFWPAQVLLAKEAKIKFRDTAQEYTDKRMATQRPVLFFVTKEISWVHTKQIKSWGQGMADGCHTKNRSSHKFCQALVQVGDLLLGRKSAPAGFTKPASPAVCSMTPITSPAPKERRSDPSSPEQAAPSGSASASKPKPKAPSAAEQFAEQQERSRNAILGGISRDERHRRRTEGRTSDSAVQSQPSLSEVPQTTVSPSKPATQSAKQCTESRRNATRPAHSTAEEQAPSACQPAATAPAAPFSADPSTAHTEQRRFSSDGVLLKRHTRSQGTAELGASDLQNLEPRKAPRRALSCAAPAATSCMGSRGTGDGATGRAPATDTPRSVGTHPPAGPFAEGKPSANGALPAAMCKFSHETNSPQDVQHVQQISVKEGSPVRSRVQGVEAAEDCIPSNDREPPTSENPLDQALARANCTSAASHMPNTGIETAVPSLASKIAPDVTQATHELAIDEGDTSARAGTTTAPLSRSGASAGQDAANADCIMEDASEPTADPPAALHSIAQQPDPPDEDTAVDDLRSTHVANNSPETAAVIASAMPQDSCQKSQPAPVQTRCTTNGHIEPEATSRMDTAPSAEVEVEEQACASRDRADDAAGFAPTHGESDVEAKLELQHDEAVLNPVIKSVEPQQRNGTAEHVLEQAPSSAIDSAVEQRDEAEGDSKSNGRRPRRAAANRKSALEMVRGETARGTPRSETPRASRTGEAAARTQTARKGGGAAANRKRTQMQAVSPENGGVSRTRARGGGGGPQAQQPPRAVLPETATVGFPPALSAPAPPAAPSAVPLAANAAAAAPHVAAPDSMCSRSMEQLAMLQARAAEQGLNTDEQMIRKQLTEFLRVRNYVVAPVAAPPVPAQELLLPIPSPEAINGIAAMLSAPRPCRPQEFWLPPELYLMRNVPHQHIDVNRYPPSIRPKKLRPQQISVCNCMRDPRYSHSDTFCCAEGCLNRTSHLLCDVRSCPCRGDCKNKPFNLRRPPAVEVRLTDSRGSGLVAKEPIPGGAFVVEYTGEVIPEKERWERMMTARKRGAVHFYIMELSKGLYIDAEHIGSNARFMNSSCDPNCETQKWKDASTGETRIGLFTTRAVRENDELTYDYQFQHAGLHAAAQGFRCMCGTPNCRGTMDINPERSRDMGRRLRVKWDGDEVWYEGYVLRFNPSNGKHTVYYPVEGSNGTQETLSLDDVEFEWVEDQFLPLCPTQPTVTAPGTHPVLPPAAQVQGAVGVLQQAAAAAMLPINPKTGRVVGDAAAEATVARNEVTNANRAASGSISQPERLQSIAPPPAVPTLHTHVLGPIQSGSNMDTVNAGVRVALPRPLPQRPLADDATAAKDGLDLLSAVAASLPERSHTPPPEPTGGPATDKKGTVGFTLPMFAVLAFLPPKLPAALTLSDALPAADPVVAPHTIAALVNPPVLQPNQQRPVGNSIVLASQRAAGLVHVAPEVPPGSGLRAPVRQPAPAVPSVRTVSPDLGSQHSQVLSQAPAASMQLPNPYSPQAAAPQALQPLQMQNHTEMGNAAHAQPSIAADTTHLHQALVQAANWPPDAQQQLAASMQVLMQAASQPFAASPALQQQQRQQMLMQVAATLSSHASKQNSNLQHPEPLNSAAPSQLHSATTTPTQQHTHASAVQVPAMQAGANSAVHTECAHGNTEHKDPRWSGHGCHPSAADSGKAVAARLGTTEASPPQPATALSNHASAFDTLIDAPHSTTQAVNTINNHAGAPTHDAGAVAIAAQTLRAVQNAGVSVNPGAVLAAVVSGSVAAGAGSNVPSTQVSSSGEDLAAVLHMPPLHPHNRALTAADADRGTHAPHPLAFAQQMPQPQHNGPGPNSIPALLATARAAVSEAHLPANQRTGTQCAHASAARAAVAPPVSTRPPAAGHFANAALTAANAAAAGPSSAQHWLVRLNVPETAVRAWIVHAGQTLGITDPLHESQRPRFLQFLNQLQYSMQVQQRHVQNAVQLQLGHMATQDAQGRAAVGGSPEQQQQAQQAFVQPTSL